MGSRQIQHTIVFSLSGEMGRDIEMGDLFVSGGDIGVGINTITG
jgi:hypothetical protein